MYHSQTVHDTAKIHTLIDGSIATTHNYRVLALEEVAIASCAVRDTTASEFVFTRNAKFVVLTTGGDDDGLGCVLSFFPDHNFGVSDHLQGNYLVKGELCPCVFGLLVDSLSDCRPQHPFREAWIVLNIGGVENLAARHQLFHN